MVDINKYLESQLALAKQKNKIKVGLDGGVSQKSKTAADFISKKEEKQLLSKKVKKSNKKGTTVAPTESPSSSAIKHSDDDSDFLPSCEEDDEPLNLNLPSTSRSKLLVKKIIDDGDRDSYDKRIQDWRAQLVAANAGNTVDGPCTADIQYILDGNKNAHDNHELQNGMHVPNYIWKQLYKYQRIGVKWLWELHQVQSGGLLGDEMGLGKTVQVIAFLAGLSHTDNGTWGGLGPSIIVAPATVIYQWVTHFHHWCPSLRVAVLHNSGSHVGNHNKLIRDLHESHGILLVTYAGVVKYHKDLQCLKWHYIILDEGHKIRNPETQVSKHIKMFQTPHRLLITGSPMQNSLQELWSLFDFMRPGLLGTYNTFMEYFAHPITQGGYANATELQEATALEIAKALKNIITPYMLRRTKSEVQEYIKLPEKNEQVLFCALTKEQKDLYMGYLMGSTVRSILDKESRYGDPIRARVLVALTTLRKLCNHPDLYLYEIQEEEPHELDEYFGHYKRSGKMIVVHSLLKIWQKQGHRALIFSQSRVMLCLLEQYFQNQNFKYLKMDGSVTIGQRQNMIKTFNDSPEYLVFLSTTRVGGLGVNLTGADRVIIYDPDWNPATDNQAKERAWRIGQQRSVTVYRLLSAGTIEEKIYQRQIFKHFLSNKILIDPNQKNVLTTSTLQGLFTLGEPNLEGDTETASLFKHTKIYANNRKQNNDKIHKNDGVSFSKKKVEAMKKMAKEISKKITKSTAVNPEIEEIDPRERYKKQRELLLNPPKVDKPEINLVDDTITNIPFDSVLSELDIINLHTKEDYEEKLIKKVLNQDNNKDEMKIDSVGCSSGEVISEAYSEENKIESLCVDSDLSGHVGNEVHSINKRKRSDSSVSKDEIENLLAVEKVKKKKHKQDKLKDSNDDDYVLNKLFAKASVKTALHHDAVVGLAEKEKRYRLKEEATKKAKNAIKAIKFSTK